MLIVFKWLPPMVYTPFWVNPWQNLAQLIWPALAVGYRYSAVATRMTRSAMLEVLREDYIRTARAKGLMQKLILSRHALKNAMLPVLTVIALEFAFLIGGLVVTEQVFNLNGLGLLFVQAVAHRDYTLHPGPRHAGGRGSSSWSTSSWTSCTPGSTRGSGTGERWPSKPTARSGQCAAGGRGPPRAGATQAVEFCRAQPLGAIGAGIIVLMLVVALRWRRCIAPYDPVANDFGAMLSRPSTRTGSAPTPSAATCSRA